MVDGALQLMIGASVSSTTTLAVHVSESPLLTSVTVKSTGIIDQLTIFADTDHTLVALSAAGRCWRHPERPGTPHDGDWVCYCEACKREHRKHAPKDTA